MIEENIITAISTVGFPIVLCLWFMVRIEKVIKNNTEILYLIKEKIKK